MHYLLKDNIQPTWYVLDELTHSKTGKILIPGIGYTEATILFSSFDRKRLEITAAQLVVNSKKYS